MRHSKVFDTAGVERTPQLITTKLIEHAVGHPFAWQATFGEWDLGDPIGVGGTEDEARADLLMEADLNAD